MLALIDGNLRTTLTSRLPERAPSFFFVDIQNHELGGFRALIEREAAGADFVQQPMLRGRIAAINDIPADEYPAGEASWVLRGDRGITYASEPPANGKVVAGSWWEGDGGDVRQVSFAEELAGELGLSLGDTVTMNVLGREVDATVTNFRTVEWESLSMNFVMMFSPNTFAGAPHAHLATLT
jgi:putative ABC transport system permease protein